KGARPRRAAGAAVPRRGAARAAVGGAGVHVRGVHAAGAASFGGRGAGHGWLSWRAATAGCAGVALAPRDDAVDRLGPAAADVDGATMAAEKRRHAAERFGDRAEALMALPAIEYLTAERLTTASAALGLAWCRRRVTYPLWYELRPYLARLRGRRAPSRFDLW